jgi:hypothetical protein
MCSKNALAHYLPGGEPFAWAQLEIAAILSDLVAELTALEIKFV